MVYSIHTEIDPFIHSLLNINKSCAAEDCVPGGVWNTWLQSSSGQQLGLPSRLDIYIYINCKRAYIFMYIYLFIYISFIYVCM